jgi:hypothetical protein
MGVVCKIDVLIMASELGHWGVRAGAKIRKGETRGRGGPKYWAPGPGVFLSFPQALYPTCVERVLVVPEAISRATRYFFC